MHFELVGEISEVETIEQGAVFATWLVCGDGTERAAGASSRAWPRFESSVAGFDGPRYIGTKLTALAAYG